MTTADSENVHISLLLGTLESHETRLFAAAFGGIFYMHKRRRYRIGCANFGSIRHRFRGGNESCATLSALSKVAISIIPTAGHGAIVDDGALTTVYQLRLSTVCCAMATVDGIGG